MLGSVRGVLLDLDNTLLDGGGIPESVRRACVDVAVAVEGLDAEELRATNVAIWGSLWRDVEKACWLGHVDGSEVSREGWRRTLLACGCSDESVVELAFASLQRHGRATERMFDDAHELLAWLENEPMPIGLVTNGPSDFQRTKLQSVGIEKAFDVVVISGEVGVAKPDPAIFQTAVDQLGLDPGDVWHVGDNLVTDVRGAQAAGLQAVWLNRTSDRPTSDQPRPDAEIASLAELPALLRPIGTS